MKILSLLFLTLFLGKGCEAQKNEDLETTVVEYVANTRGFYKKIIVQNKTITVSKDRRGDDNPAPVKIADAEWQKIIEVKAVDNKSATKEMQKAAELAVRKVAKLIPAKQGGKPVRIKYSIPVTFRIQ